jgi:hypothetical protein
MRILAFILTAFSVSTSQAQLPEVTTTYDKALQVYSRGDKDEGWFVLDGRYTCIFRNTPVGIVHAYEKYSEMLKFYNTNSCEIKDIISPKALNEDKSLNYEMLAITIEKGMSEVVNSCLVKEGPIQLIRFVSMGGSTPMWMIFLVPRKNE